MDGNAAKWDRAVQGDRRSRLRVYYEGRCSRCDDFGPMDINLMRCDECAALLRQENRS